MLKFKTQVNNDYMLKEIWRRIGSQFILVAVVGLLALVYSFGLFILVEVAAVLAGAFSLYTAYLKFKDATISIVDNELHIDCGPKKQWVIWDEPLSNFEFKQTDQEAAANVGTMNIKGSIFCIGGIENFVEFKANVIEHCAK